MYPRPTWRRGIDLIAVERAASREGDCPALTEEEQQHACEVMTQAGWSAQEIAIRLGVCDRTVSRWRRVLEGGAA